MSVSSRLEEIGNDVRDYAENRISIMKLDAAEKGSRVASHVIAGLVIALMFSIAIIFFSIGLALLIAKLTGEFYLGFFSICAFYVLISILLWRFKEKLIQLPLLNSILNKLFEKNENNPKH